MRLHTLFRFSSYLCLTLSTACLGLAESTQLEGVVVFYVAIGLVLLAEFLTADRWLMPQSVANLVAIAILIGWLFWFVLGLDLALEDQYGQWLPRAGPLLGVLLVAKLLRPKETSDYWMLHLLGLVQVMLACVLALQSRLDRESPWFPALLVAYALSLVWALKYFYLYREAEAAHGRSVSGKASTIVPASAILSLPAPWRTLGTFSALAWFCLAMLLGLFVFFAIPRPGQDASASLMIPGSGRAQTGFNPGLDLNETSPIEVSEEEVMRVDALDANGQRVALDSDQQRWRGVACTIYNAGRWSPARTNDAQVLQVGLPDRIQPHQLRLSFGIDLAKLQGGWRLLDEDRPTMVFGPQGSQPLFLAEPVTSVRTLPRVGLDRRENSQTMLAYRTREMTLSSPNVRRSRRLWYDQIFDLPSDQEWQWGQPTAFQLQQLAQRNYWETLLSMPVKPEEVEAFAAKAREILAKAGIDSKPLTEGKLSGEKKRQLRISIAQALERHLSGSPNEYGYTLDRPRKDHDLDPTLDFLTNTKQGHCGLYASALTLMLRSQGIPARVIIGFRGARWNSVGEWHSVCQYHAHAWVEAFIEEANNPPIPPAPSAAPATAAAGQTAPKVIATEGRWLTLDATPAGGTAGLAGASSTGLIEDQINFLRYVWEFFILDYSGDQQREKLLAKLNSTFNLQDIRTFWSTVAELLQRGNLTAYAILLGALALLVTPPLLIFGLWRRRRARQPGRSGPTVTFYARFLRLMERLRLRPAPSQTPAEFAALAAQTLKASARTASAAEVPPEVADDFYLVRYGGQTLDADAQARTGKSLDRLESLLKK